MTEEALELVASDLAKDISKPWSPGQEVGTVLICKNAMLRMGLKHLLANTCFTVSDAAFDETSSLPWAPAAMPVLFIVDASHSPEGTAEAVGRLKFLHPKARIAVLADHFERNLVIEEHAAGADGFILTTTDRDVLIRSLELVMLGQAVFPSAMVLSMLDDMAGLPERPSDGIVAISETTAIDRPARKLSNREAEILGCLMQGAPNKVIARRLDVAEATVKVHVKAILRKVGAANRTQAAIWATENLPTRGAAALNA
jgi:two-component system, NarL family, nitrate/nitrite response regulator NarL